MAVEVVIGDGDRCAASLPLRRLLGPAQLQKAVNALGGIVAGIGADTEINTRELNYLEVWFDAHLELEDRHPFNELVPLVRQAVADGRLTSEEKADVLWLCERLSAHDFVDIHTGNMQHLHAMLGGIAADAQINETELRSLAEWLASHDHLRTRWPYDEVDSLVTAVLQDGRIDPAEHVMLMSFFSEFAADRSSRSTPSTELTIGGVCAACPEITIKGSAFAFTGASARYTRAEFTEVVETRGGRVMPGVSSKIDYLIVGADGNPCWAYACYGRKVERAIELRRNGAQLQIVHENDFHDAIEDLD